MRSTILNLEESKIREVANAGLGRSDVLAFWFGESDEVTPDFIRQAAIDSLQQGETFYAHNLGLPELRGAIARAMSAKHPQHRGGMGPERIGVTSGGVNALMLPCVSDDQDAVLRTKSTEEGAHLFGTRETGLVEHVEMPGGGLGTRMILSTGEEALKRSRLDSSITELPCSLRRGRKSLNFVAC